MSFRKIADISIACGFYQDGDKIKQRQRKIGELVEFTNDQTGASFQKLKLNADALSPSLMIMARAAAGKDRAGDDTIMCSLWEEKPEKPAPDGRAPAQTPKPPSDPALVPDTDDIPY